MTIPAMKQSIPLLIVLLLIPQPPVSAADAGLPAPNATQTSGSLGVSPNAGPPKPGTVVTISAEGNQYASIWKPEITAIDGVREGKWGGAMWCPFFGTSVKLIGNTGPDCGMADVFIWIGDSIRDNMPPYARTVWLPMVLTGKGAMEIRWRDSWDLSVFGGP